MYPDIGYLKSDQYFNITDIPLPETRARIPQAASECRLLQWSLL